MANLSKIKREKMLEYLEKLKEINNDDENIRAVTEIENALNEKKYGLVWEEHSEKVDEMLKHNIPIFVEDENRKIIANENESYNFLLEGDNLHSLKLLEKTHKGKIDVIYIDPPYNTKSSQFIYDDKYVEVDDSYSHSKWLSLMSERIVIAKKLLSKVGIIFVSIDDNEVANLKLLLNQIFGESRFVGMISWEKRTKPQNTKTAKYMLQSKIEYILVFKNFDERFDFNLFEIEERKYPEEDEKGKYRNEQIGEMSASGMRGRKTMIFPIKGVYPKEGNQWKFGKETINKFETRGDLFVLNGKVYFKIRPDDESIKEEPFWGFKDKQVGTAEVGKKELSDILKTKEHGFETVKPVRLIFELIYHVVHNNKNAIVLDFFAGSGTTGHAVMQLNKEDGGNRKYILCTNNENNICEEITYQRLKNIQEELPHNLKYYKTEFIPKFSDNEESISDKMMKHIRELIELEYAIELDGKKYIILDDEDKLDEIISKIGNDGKLFVRSGIFLSRNNQRILEEKGVSIIEIPEYYFREELKEVGEL